MIFFSIIAYSNDSTGLYKGRIQKLKEFSEWLSKEAKDEISVEGIYYQYDSTANKNWKIFDKAIDLFFNKRILDSIIESTAGQNNIFSPSFKRRMLKGFIGRFNDLSHRVIPDSIKFKSEQSMQGNVPSKKGEIETRNVIIQYFIIDGEPIQYLSFWFEDGKPNLIGMNVSEPQGEEGRKLFQYFQTLRKKS
jgi:hypothetical protein